MFVEEGEEKILSLVAGARGENISHFRSLFDAQN
jgi:hypothetical protein